MESRVTFRRGLAKAKGGQRQGWGKLNAHTKGKWAEHLALLVMLSKGYRPAPRPVRMLAQTDLLLRRGKVLVLVEVKARASESRAQLALGPGQRARLGRQARALAGRWPQYTVRLDMLLVFPQWPFFRHMENVGLD